MSKLFFTTKHKTAVIFSLIFLPGIFCMQPMEGQVTIGANRPPHSGAVLELESHKNLGLLLPYVSLQSAVTWQLNGMPAEGMLVYNESASTANGLSGKGAYVWINNRWRPMKDSPATGSADPVITAITASKTSVKPNEIFQVWVETDPAVEIVQYVWTATGGGRPIGHSNREVISLAGRNTGDVHITVKAIGASGKEATRSISVNVVN
ncbi:MAG: hypothetical protein LBH58_00530 [Tannerellaceae bacterium]|nr:hypothetical protein [Tannerellaceae bacterium]